MNLYKFHILMSLHFSSFYLLNYHHQ